MKQAIVLKHLKKQFIKEGVIKHAIRDVSLNVQQGDFVGLLGENGAGKSTMINILSSMLQKTSGTVIINGFNIDKYPLKAKYHIGIVPQELHLDPFLTVREILYFQSFYYGVKPNKKYIADLLDTLHLKAHIDSVPRQLSGGMRRRVLIAKALIHDPSIIILDEPTAGIDVALRQRLWDYITFLHQEYKKTILLTTHYIEEAQALCNKIAIMKLGKVVAYDTTQNFMCSINKRASVIKVSNLDLEKAEAMRTPSWCTFDRRSGQFHFLYTGERLANTITSLRDSDIAVDDIYVEPLTLANAIKNFM